MIQNLPNITIYGTLSLLELIWLLVLVPGLLFSVANVLDSRKDSAALADSGEATEKDWIIANQRARNAKTAVLIELMFVGFALASAFTPNPAQVSWLAYVVSAVIFFGTGRLSWGAWKDTQDRRRIRMPGSLREE